MNLTNEGYRQRILDDLLLDYLQAFGAVCLEGPKWCGKTWTALNHASSVFYTANPENNFQNRTMAQLSPGLVLQGENPRLLDEWQEVPALWDAVRFKVDQTNLRGQFILTGSATPNHKGILHSGTGRIARMMMRPMTLFESGDSDGEISLIRLFQDPLQAVSTQIISLEHLINLVVRGGWPASLGLDIRASSLVPKAYLRSVVEEDVFRVDGIKRETRKMYMLLRSLARNESTIANNQTLARDVFADDGETINVDTVADYLDVFNRLFILDDQKAYNPNLRSSVRVGKSAKRHFVDPSLAVAAMDASPERLLNDLNTFGFLFEGMCIRDMRIYAESFGGQLFHYRDHSGREIDAIIELPDGRWGAFEIKLGSNQIDAAAKDLLAIQKFMAEDPKAKPPELLCVICGLANYAYTREDGVRVVPITSLAP